jgi:hypothetical protein
MALHIRQNTTHTVKIWDVNILFHEVAVVHNTTKESYQYPLPNKWYSSKIESTKKT